jgi:hypothetical protein
MTIVVAADPPPPPSLRRDGEVFILGAGFSKAIGTRMPTLNELGLRISLPFRRTPSFRLLPPAAKAALKASRMPGGSIEAWLSHLATPAPFLDQSERLHNAAIAQELIRLIVAEIERSEAFTLGGQMPAWLGRLVSLWDRLGATIITFNYDTLVEGLDEKRFHVVMPPTIAFPNRTVPGGTVPVFKLHGSVDWETDENFAVKCDRNKNAIDHNVALAIAAPGRSKGNLTGSLFHDLWKGAKVKLNEAAEIVVIGYSFPKTDALARMTLLDAIANENCGAQVRRASLVLGPDVDLPGNRRVLELLRHRMGTGREVFVNPAVTGSLTHRGTGGAAVINQHRLWAEDFIGDYSQRTGPSWP